MRHNNSLLVESQTRASCIESSPQIFLRLNASAQPMLEIESYLRPLGQVPPFVVLNAGCVLASRISTLGSPSPLLLVCRRRGGEGGQRGYSNSSLSLLRIPMRSR